MNDRQAIVYCGQQCERALLLADAFPSLAGQYRALAEKFALAAFEFAA
jgi:hypothetical protein